MPDSIRASHILRNVDGRSKEDALREVEDIKAVIDDGADFGGGDSGQVEIQLTAHEARHAMGMLAGNNPSLFQAVRSAQFRVHSEFATPMANRAAPSTSLLPAQAPSGAQKRPMMQVRWTEVTGLPVPPHDEIGSDAEKFAEKAKAESHCPTGADGGDLVLITGRGKHSADGRPLVRGAVLDKRWGSELGGRAHVRRVCCSADLEPASSGSWGSLILRGLLRR